MLLTHHGDTVELTGTWQLSSPERTAPPFTCRHRLYTQLQPVARVFHYNVWAILTLVLPRLLGIAKHWGETSSRLPKKRRSTASKFQTVSTRTQFEWHDSAAPTRYALCVAFPIVAPSIFFVRQAPVRAAGCSRLESDNSWCEPIAGRSSAPGAVLFVTPLIFHDVAT